MTHATNYSQGKPKTRRASEYAQREKAEAALIPGANERVQKVKTEISKARRGATDTNTWRTNVKPTARR